jgi:hypothetical protein
MVLPAILVARSFPCQPVMPRLAPDVDAGIADGNTGLEVKSTNFALPWIETHNPRSVIAGLDPAIHPVRMRSRKHQRITMKGRGTDATFEPWHDGGGMFAPTQFRPGKCS